MTYEKIFVILSYTLTLAASAQDSTLKEYVGKYIFPKGSERSTHSQSFVTWKCANSEFCTWFLTYRKRSRDMFEVVNFEGMPY